MLSLWVVSPAGAVDPGACAPTPENACGAPPSPPAWEQDLKKVTETWDVCQADIEKFCEGVQVGEGRLEACLKKHKKKLSRKCRKAQGWSAQDNKR